MEKQVIFRDRQEFQAADPNALQGYVRAAIDHVVQDAVSGEKHYTGFGTAASSSSTVTVAAGRFYTGGQVFVSESEQTLSLFNYVPLVASRVVAVVVWGQEVDAAVEARDFLVDLQTGATEPQAVAMERTRRCQVNLLAGGESADPQPPVLQSGTLAVARVYLTPSGITRVEMQPAMLPNGYDQGQRLGVIEVWQAAAEPRISSIATDLAALAIRCDAKLDRSVYFELAADLATLKNRSLLPSSYSSYEADAFADATKQNQAHAGYAARVENGLLFPFAASGTANLALFNPIDAAVKTSSEGLVLPAYLHAPRIKTQGYAGDLSISQYQVQSLSLRARTCSFWGYHYGWNYNFYRRWYAVNLPYRYWALPWYGYWYSRPGTYYVPALTTASYSGAMIAQTFLNANAGWLSRLGLFFTSNGSVSGDVRVVVCETAGGKPDLGSVVAQATVAQSDLKFYPQETPVDLPHVLLEAGKRYAVVLISPGNHRVATVSGNAYTQGTLFYGSDGDYFVGDLTRDLMFTVYCAQFARARTEVQLQPVSLSGGLTDIGIDAPHVVPDGCVLQYEIQPQGSGTWYPLGAAAMYLGADSTAPNLCNLRVVLLGTSDLQPAFAATTGAISVSRPATSAVSWSAARTLAAASTSVQLKLLLADWDAVNHTITVRIVTGGTTETAPSTTVTDVVEGATRKHYTFTIPSSSSYEIKISGARASGSKPFAIINRIDVAL